jgi:hypothetical protein
MSSKNVSQKSSTPKFEGVSYSCMYGEKSHLSYLSLNTIKANHGMLDDEKFSDFKVIVKGTAYHVHKVVLANASPVFRAMFESGMEESKTNVCKVEDIDKDTFWKLLLFIYCGLLHKKLEDKAIDLYKAAHYYEIEDLKTICHLEMIKILKQENAVKIHECAHQFDLEDLKEKAWEIIKR